MATENPTNEFNPSGNDGKSHRMVLLTFTPEEFDEFQQQVGAIRGAMEDEDGLEHSIEEAVLFALEG